MVYSVFLYPVSGVLNATAIERFLSRQPDVLLDPLGTDTYIVCGVPEAKKTIFSERMADQSRFPYAVLVTVKPECVNVFQEHGDEDGLRSARNIVQWILAHERCRVQDGYYEDWTERVAQQGADVLYPEWLT
jgi:hypothetical protein